jgi:tetratricopeptide (TPR) repeat protein
MANLESIERAIAIQDYQSASQLLQELQQQNPDNPWLLYYTARLEEVRGKISQAEQNYRQVLQSSTHPKIISQARQGIERLIQLEKTQRRQARDRAMAESGSEEVGILVLEPMEAQYKEIAIPKFAKIMNLDPYIARLQLPTRSWRLYRAGLMGEMRYYNSALREAEIPCFCLPLSQINQIKVYQIQYFEAVFPKAIAICQHKKGQPEIIEFAWSEISQRLDALLPIFERCLDSDVRGKLIRKTQIQDYAKFCDLHLPQKKLILRLCDRDYKFQEGFMFSEKQKSTDGRITLRDNWNYLIDFIGQQRTNIPVWSDFKTFAGMAMDFQETLKSIEPNINLLRREDTPLDAIF